MKKLSYLTKINKYVSLKDIDEQYKIKLSNLEGYKINECCCNYDCCDDTCCEPCCKCDPAIYEPTPINTFGRFNSEQEITTELDTQPKVTTLYDIHSQFGRFTFDKDGHSEPLYFGYQNDMAVNITVNRENGDMPKAKANSQETITYNTVCTRQNKKIYKLITELVDTYDFECPVIQTKINGEVQVYVIKHTGSNGVENSIKTSLEEVAKILGKLDSKNEILWSQVLDVSIDNVDDVYSFVITFTFDNDKVKELSKIEKLC